MKMRQEKSLSFTSTCIKEISGRCTLLLAKEQASMHSLQPVHLPASATISALRAIVSPPCPLFIINILTLYAFSFTAASFFEKAKPILL
jgi:hypothetical protein